MFLTHCIRVRIYIYTAASAQYGLPSEGIPAPPEQI